MVIMSIVRMLHPESFIPGYEQLQSGDPHLLLAALNSNDEVAIESNERTVIFES